VTETILLVDSPGTRQALRNLLPGAGFKVRCVVESATTATTIRITADLYRLAECLASCGVKTVAMQSTGVYWIPLYEILEEHGFEVYLVNARHTKNLPGRRSDVQENQWLLKLHTYGLLNNSFQPRCPSSSCYSVLPRRLDRALESIRTVPHSHKDTFWTLLQSQAQLFWMEIP